MLQELNKFNKPGLWLAVITKNNSIKVVASSKSPKESLTKARKKGFKEVSLMMSSERYASWIPLLTK